LNMRPWYDRSQHDDKGNGHLYIVSRSNPRLYQFLAHEFPGDRGIRVVLDRREHTQWGVSRRDERRHFAVDEDLRAWELALSPALEA